MKGVLLELGEINITGDVGHSAGASVATVATARSTLTSATSCTWIESQQANNDEEEKQANHAEF